MAAAEATTLPKSRSADRFREAYGLLNRLLDSMEQRPFPKHPKDKPIGRLVDSAEHLGGCSSIINAMVLTGFRAAIFSELLMKPPLPSVWSHVTNYLQPGSDGDPNLVGVHSKEFVALLAAAIQLNSLGHINAALRIVYELRAQAENGALDDWQAAVASSPTLQPLESPSLVRFALASLGAKVARKLFRKQPAERSDMPPQLAADMPVDDSLSTASLLDAIDIFASEQRRLQPSSAVGYWNGGWVYQQSCAVRGWDGLACCASTLKSMIKCFVIADEAQDDFYSSGGRIEAAMCTVMGGVGCVGYEVFPGGFGRVIRDMALEQPKESAWKLQCAGASDEIRQAVGAHEKKRLGRGVQPATLEAGEKLLIPWWTVLELWNGAIPAYDRLAKWKHNHVVCKPLPQPWPFRRS